ncbi:hypothetical protein [Silvanigrella aquatica]|uniref:Lipoprotein n=1 Tax=Silvanigrella aquatica TaxID=1915309 RepID=A0A1L4D103_9BACT|nr:hypothetical protein [Silvanigrella aquatica]APJ03860.1 hypothetical protein AXG55_08050 [Silvanigrella aquatica]
MKLLFSLLLILLFLPSCQKNSSSEGKQYVVFLGLPNKDVTLYKVTKNNKDKKIYYPLMRLTTNTKILLPMGNYLLANECTSYEFFNDGTHEQKVVLSKLSLNFGKNNQNQVINKIGNTFNSLCYDPLDKQEHWFINKSEFDILPGKNILSVSGRDVELNLHPTLFSDKKIQLWPLTLSSPINTDSSKFFSLPLDLTSTEKKFVISSPVNSTVWLQSGRYQIEVNGSKQIVNIKDSSSSEIKLGVIRIVSPKNFPIEKRLQAGGQPIFAFINEKVLFRLNTDYPVFPGKYRVTLEGSEIEKYVTVIEDQVSEVKTRGALVLSPPCDNNYDKCRHMTRITIHINRMPFILMTELTDMPFLVFDQKYEYGIEGIKGIFKILGTSEDSVKIDKLGKVKIKWETRYTTGNIKTDFVRFESKGVNVFGKSIDLMYFKPDEIYLPEGEFLLTYFVGDQNLVLPKTRIDVILAGGTTKEFVIPVYTQKTSDGQQSEKNKNNTTYTTNTTLSPIKD